MHAILNTSPHDCTSATCIHCIPDKARLNILSLFFCVFFLDLPPFLEQLRGPQETCQSREEKAKGRERGREVAVIEKQKSKWRPDSAGAQKKKKRNCGGVTFSSSLQMLFGESLSN